MTTTTRCVDYDLIASLYNEPGRDFEPDRDLIQFLSEKPALEIGQMRILDLGCGTGKQLAADQAMLPGLRAAGLDLFHGMLRQAHRRSDVVSWIQGDSVHPPFAEASFDYITNQFSYHHVREKTKMIAEAYRLLKRAGRFVITNLDPWSMVGWILYGYFPAAWQRDIADFLTVEQLTSTMGQIGFRDIRVRRQLNRSQENLGEFLAYASQRYRTSQLTAIPDRDYESGIAKLTSCIRALGSRAQVASEICLVWVTGDKPA